MKKNLLLIAALATLQLSAIAQNPVPNPGFENWTGGNPDNWFTSNVAGFVTCITQTTPSHAGNWAAKGQPATVQGSIMPPLLATIDANGNGFPITQLYGQVSFYYKFNAVAGDIMAAVVIINDNQGNALGAGSIDFTSSVSGYTQAIIPISYGSTGTPGDAIIEFLIDDANGTGNPSTQSYYVVDDVVLSGTSGIANNTPTENKMVIFPNPTKDEAQVRFISKDGTELNLSLFDLSGKKVSDYQFKNLSAGLNTRVIDTKNLKNGAYVLRSYGSQLMSAPIIIAH